MYGFPSKQKNMRILLFLVIWFCYFPLLRYIGTKDHRPY